MSLSLAQILRRATAEQRQQIIAKLSPQRQLEMINGKPWWLYGRPEQWEPTNLWWRWWLINAGRGWGKTRTGAEWTKDKAERHPGALIAGIGPTFNDARNIMMEGDSGLLSILAPSMLRGGSFDTAWNRSFGELYFANGSHMQLFSSERPIRLRGPQHHFVWGDEPAYWLDAHLGMATMTTFNQANIGLRLPARAGWPAGYHGQGVLTTTPRLVPLFKVDERTLIEHPDRAGLLQRRDTVVTYGRSLDNLDNLEAGYLREVIEPLMGTSIGLQELEGIMLEDTVGALWTRQLIESTRRELPFDLFRTVASFDPAGGDGAGHDEHGIIIASLAGDPGNLDVYIRADYSGPMSVEEAARQWILAAVAYGADTMVYEKNQGQDWIPATVRGVYRDMIADGSLPPGAALPRLEPVTATKDKYLRAQPIAVLYESGHVHHAALLPGVEAQMTTWIPGVSDSPDRLDALVWAVQWLRENGPGVASVASAARREAAGRSAGMPSTRLPRTYGLRAPRRR